MIVHVKNKSGKKLYFIVDVPNVAGLHAEALAKAGPVSRFLPASARLRSSSKSDQGSDLRLRAVGSPSTTATRFPAVLIVHGFKGFSAERHIAAISKALVSAGFLTMRVDLTKNPGNSYLDFSDMTYRQEFSDLEDAFNYLLKMPEVDLAKIGITGHSMGGTLAAQLASFRKEVKSLVTLSAVYDFQYVAKRIFKKAFSKVKKDFEEKGTSAVWSQSLHKDLFIKKKFYEDVVFRSAAKFAKDITCPTLVISSANDESVSRSHADRYFKTAGAKLKKMEVIPGSDHNYTTPGALSQVTKSVTNWFAKTLKAS